MKRILPLTAIALAIGLSTQANADVVKGEDYKVLDNPETISGDIIIVREFFWYGCIHCFKLEPYMHKWLATKPKDVAFFYTPGAMNPVWENSARGFYTAQMMGYQDKTHGNLFKAVFKQPKPNMALAGSSKDAVIDWYASQGLDKEKFSSYFDSFAVNTKIARSNAGAKRYQITGTPSVVVQGKYVVTTRPEKMGEVIDFLVDKVREEKKK